MISEKENNCIVCKTRFVKLIEYKTNSTVRVTDRRVIMLSNFSLNYKNAYVSGIKFNNLKIKSTGIMLMKICKIHCAHNELACIFEFFSS